jgi:drug/metabolite transporter (DMT)-like permease
MKNVQGAQHVAYASLVAMAVCFGGTWPAGKIAAEHVAPATVATTRFAAACLLLVVWAHLSHRRVRLPARRDLPLVLAMGASAVALYNLFFLYGLRLTPASDGSIIVPGLIPVFTTLLAWRLLGERPGRSVAIGFALALGGLVLVVDPVGGVDTRRLSGDLVLVGAATSWTVYTFVARRASARFDSVTANVYLSGSGALMLLPLSFFGGGWSRLGGAPGSAWAAIGYLAGIGTVLGFVLFSEGVRVVGVGPTAAFTLLVPVFGVLGSVLVLAEPLRVTLVAGGALVIAGLWLVQRSQRVPDFDRDHAGVRR